MQIRLLTASVLVLGVALVSPATAVGPKATKWQTTMTSPTSARPKRETISAASSSVCTLQRGWPRNSNASPVP